ncbi:MAG: hypothetical protein M5U19_10770 [Microthrixaceae bacterium]|nr:hypothetical protein [Microthrixaceae bacterium]
MLRCHRLHGILHRRARVTAAGRGDRRRRLNTTAGGKPSDAPGEGAATGPEDTSAELGASQEEAREEVAELLERFDAALTALYANPLAAGDDEHPLSVKWLEVVVGGSQLDRQVRGRILASATRDRMRIVPDAHGTSFANVAIGLNQEPDGSLTWTNCGYAPGVGVDLGTGQVLDDNRTSTRGRGRAVRGPDGRLSISELWDDETVLLDPGEPDPCITLADRPAGGRP